MVTVVVRIYGRVVGEGNAHIVHTHIVHVVHICGSTIESSCYHLDHLVITWQQHICSPLQSSLSSINLVFLSWQKHVYCVVLASEKDLTNQQESIAGSSLNVSWSTAGSQHNTTHVIWYSNSPDMILMKCTEWSQPESIPGSALPLSSCGTHRPSQDTWAM